MVAAIRWTPELDATLLRLRASGLTSRQIAVRMPVTMSLRTICKRLKTLALPQYDPRRGRLPPRSTEPPGSRSDCSRPARRAAPVHPIPPEPEAEEPAAIPSPHEPALRKCLGARNQEGDPCGQMFLSTHAGHRICPRCRAAR